MVLSVVVAAAMVVVLLLWEVAVVVVVIMLLLRLVVVVVVGGGAVGGGGLVGGGGAVLLLVVALLHGGCVVVRGLGVSLLHCGASGAVRLLVGVFRLQHGVPIRVLHVIDVDLSLRALQRDPGVGVLRNSNMLHVL